MSLGPPSPMRGAGMARAGFSHALLLSNFAGGAGDFGDGLGAGASVAFASFLVALVDDAAVQDVHSYGLEAEGGGGEVKGADGGSVDEGVDRDVEAMG